MARIAEPQSLYVDQNGRVLIPSSIRKALGLKTGDRLVAWVEEGRLIIRLRAELVKELRKKFRLKTGEESATQTLRRMRDEESY